MSRHCSSIAMNEAGLKERIKWFKPDPYADVIMLAHWYLEIQNMQVFVDTKQLMDVHIYIQPNEYMNKIDRKAYDLQHKFNEYSKFKLHIFCEKEE